MDSGAYPLFNESENPRYKTLALQKVIARTVNESNRLWTFAEMREYIHAKYKTKLSYNQIDVALANKQKDLSRYCGTSQEKQLLVPKKKQRKQKNDYISCRPRWFSEVATGLEGMSVAGDGALKHNVLELNL